jgi:hypothetical protein
VPAPPGRMPGPAVPAVRERRIRAAADVKKPAGAGFLGRARQSWCR